MTKKRRNYNDEFRASTVLMLEAAGYPHKKGALTAVANRVNVPAMTISRWFKASNNPPPNKIVNEKKIDFLEMLREERNEALREMSKCRETATYKDLATVVAIFTDKEQLLLGNANWRVEVVDLVKNGKVSFDDVKRELGDELATELFITSSV